MRLSWNEIRARAHEFANKYATAHYERGETQTFYNEFFHIFGTERRSVARYEEHVKKLNDKHGFIDLFWPKTLLVEQKSAGRDLTQAREQAGEYFDAIKESDRPRFQLLCDFQTFELLDRDTREEVRFTLPELPQHVERFGFIMGVQQRAFRDQDPVNIEAAELMGNLHDALKDFGYTGHDLKLFLVRTVFCLFADDTDIFARDVFLNLLEDRTAEDGSDLGNWLSHLFQVLDTPEDKRQSNLDADLAKFPYINGDLFGQPLRIPAFDSSMREALIAAANFNWSEISPAIFGSLFQSVMDAKERRAAGAHYTTEKNILKVIEPLFLDGLRAEFERLKARKDNRRRAELERFKQRLGTLTFLDPACGCGNFLIIAYRELRALEIEVLLEIAAYDRNAQGELQTQLDVSVLSVVDVDQFYGIEKDDFPAEIAKTALWMMDHIMNNRLSAAFGQAFARFPLKKSPHIILANALETDWKALLSPKDCSYILGNPPFIGHQYRTKKQQADMWRVWGREGQVNRLDYVTCWLKLAVEYSKHNRKICVGLVSTNSISQGEQASILWPKLQAEGAELFFAHRTFEWTSEARGRAAVHCVIVGFSLTSIPDKRIFEYQNIRGEPSVATVDQINGWLVNGPQYALPVRGRPPAGRPQALQGSKPADGARIRKPEGGYIKRSNLILDDSEREKLLAADPSAEKWLRPYVGSDELISGTWRWCLWLKDADPRELRQSLPIMERLERVREGRLLSPTESVREFAKVPAHFTQDRQPDCAYLAIPEVSSERREYIPMAMLRADVIANNMLLTVAGAKLFDFALLTSSMHMGWMRAIAGRLESRYRYAPAVYNTFPLPPIPAEEMERVLTPHAEAVLAARANHADATLADLYDPLTMPQDLRRAHTALDRAVDRLYRPKGFASERERVEHLFMLYEKLRVPLDAAADKPKRRRRKKTANAAGGPG